MSGIWIFGIWIFGRSGHTIVGSGRSTNSSSISSSSSTARPLICAGGAACTGRKAAGQLITVTGSGGRTPAGADGRHLDRRDLRDIDEALRHLDRRDGCLLSRLLHGGPSDHLIPVRHRDRHRVSSAGTDTDGAGSSGLTLWDPGCRWWSPGRRRAYPGLR